jgi:hypothetical protein
MTTMKTIGDLPSSVRCKLEVDLVQGWREVVMCLDNVTPSDVKAAAENPNQPCTGLTKACKDVDLETFMSALRECGFNLVCKRIREALQKRHYYKHDDQKSPPTYCRRQCRMSTVFFQY